ncbi:hypothetical protein [Metallosphaera sp.]|uniref:hypothetical protein n=1 Tax=Metallosphaera sp. TaxID=2020860 RepID=UPI00279CFB2E|nr:hypothetical protein SPV3_ORF2 [Sulfolobus polyhedral virus 3]
MDILSLVIILQNVFTWYLVLDARRKLAASVQDFKKGLELMEKAIREFERGVDHLEEVKQDLDILARSVRQD